MEKFTAPKIVGVGAGNKKREPSPPALGAWAAGGFFCGALRLAVASAQGAAGLSSVPVAPPGEAIISAFCARAPRRPQAPIRPLEQGSIEILGPPKRSRIFFAAFLEENIFWENLENCNRRS